MTANQQVGTVVPASGDPIEHVVVLMLENRSFDHMLGALRAFDPHIDGVDPAHPGVNRDAQTGADFAQQADAQPLVGQQFSVPHEFADVAVQLNSGMGGFITAFRNQHPDASTEDLGQVMAYFKDGDLPVLHALAKAFLVCDRWFSSLPGPTWPNRLFVHSGTSLGDVLMPAAADPASIREFWGRYTQDTIYDRLDAAGKTWKIYHQGFPQSVILDRLKQRFLSDRYASMEDFVSDAANAAANAAEFPNYAFIEPCYFDGLFAQENDQHPPAGVAEGERLIAQVYNAIRASDALWASTLLIVVYDEHGGLYDHFVPPPAVAPDDHVTSTFGFDRLGVRVPAILISPYVKRGVDHTVYDHTSVLRYLCEKWNMPYLCRRTDPAAGVNVIGNFAGAISPANPRIDTPAILDEPPPAPTAAVPAGFDSAQASLVAFGELMMKGAVADRPAVSGAPTAASDSAALALPQRARRLEQWMARAKKRGHPPR